MTVPSLDQFAWRRELRELDDDRRDFLRLMATATVRALSEGRASTITTNVPEVLDCCRQLARHFSASATVEEVERDGLIDLIFRPGRKARAAETFFLKPASYRWPKFPTVNTRPGGNSNGRESLSPKELQTRGTAKLLPMLPAFSF
jgi:hypothetical protein